ncbi:MAG: hypothetical protein H0W44_02800 [Gammaproteobacteria bacterium]|nr:hypothetical protein [Gammaproteobacteria bacterium]
MIRYISIAALLVTISFPATSAEIGLGVDLGGSSYLSMPIRTARYIIEPFVFHESTDDEEPLYSTHNLYRYAYSNSSDVSSLGVGIYKHDSFTGKILFNYGLNFGYSRKKVTSVNEYHRVIDQYNDYEYLDRRSHNLEGDGFFIAPRLGFEYKAHDKIYLGIGAVITYKKMELKGSNDKYEYSYNSSLGGYEEKYSSIETSTDDSSVHTGMFVMARIYL